MITPADALLTARTKTELNAAMDACLAAGISRIRVSDDLNLPVYHAYWLRVGQIITVQYLMKEELAAHEGEPQA